MTQLERLIILRVFDNLRDLGWLPYETQPDAYDSSWQETTPDALAVLPHLEATGDALVYVRREGRTRWLRFILGNTGWDVLSDYSVPWRMNSEAPVNDAFDDATSEASDWAESYMEVCR